MNLIGSLFPEPGIVVVEAELGELKLADGDLFPEEAPAVARAIDKRKQEFIAGRVLARRAFELLGHPPAPVVQAADRSPVWPAELTGSITHTTGFCAVVVAEARDFVGLGVDVEPDEPLKENLWQKILTPRELLALHARPAAERGRFAKLVFCAKEAAYKAQHAVTKTFLGFDAMDIQEVQAGATFRAVLNQAVGSHFASGTVLDGRFGAAGGRLAAAVTIER